ncbi:unnamed protein product [Nezara viridula]|uniref:Receptor ligand binding region domain-containing protein n=1 Tax=Nezara viridula TaxID=85310 RepID=A0A9P0MMW2_NEZVI|nr:unnamed protein product [Nezara viridula]
MNDLVTKLEVSNISCKAAVTFAEGEIESQLQALKDSDTRIIIGSFSPSVAPKVFCEAYKLGMFGEDYGWLVQGSPEDGWWMTEHHCGHHLASAAQGVILVSSYSDLIGQHQLSGLSREELSSVLSGGGYSRESYDAVWAIALALSAAQNDLDLSDFQYTRADVGRVITQELGSLRFNGLSGPVSFDGPDRVGITAFYQIQGKRLTFM